MSREAQDAAEPNPVRGDDQFLRRLTSTARELAEEVPGPLRRITLKFGGACVELEWEDGARDGADVARSTGALVLSPSPGEEVPPTMVRSPIVGTFYHAQAPGEPPFVAIGGTVEPDTVIGIVEAMKLMNPVIAGHVGVVRSILVPDSSPVQFDQPLVVLDPLLDQDGRGR